MTSMTSTDIFLTVAFSVIVLINLLGNGLVCLVFLRFRGMRAPLNYLLVNLAVSDLIVAVGVIPQYVIKWAFHDHRPNGTAGDYICTFGNFIWIGGAASVFSLAAIAGERYLTVVRPRGELPGRSIRRLTVVIVGSWIYALVFDLPLFFMVRYDDNKFYCREQWANKTVLAKAYTIGAFFLFAVIPMGTMAILYTMILCKLWKSAHVERLPLISDQDKLKARIKVTKMVFFVSILYAVCWLPNLVLYMLSQFKPDLYKYDSVYHKTSVVLVVLNSAMNPFVYTLCSANFRQNIRRALSFGRNRSAYTI